MKIAIIGAGNLGVAIALGAKRANSNIEINVSRKNINTIQYLEKKQIHVYSNNIECIKNAEIIILAIKPFQLEIVLEEINQYLDNQILVSVVTGKSIEVIKSKLTKEISIIRAMPNTAISENESMTCICTENANENELNKIVDFFEYLGTTLVIEEKLMNAATVLGACGIAYALRYIRAGMQAGIQIGFDAKSSLEIVTQTVIGASKLLENNKTHPEQEIDKVTTPQGCTIVGLNEMEHKGFSSAIIQGIQTSFDAIKK